MNSANPPSIGYASKPDYHHICEPWRGTAIATAFIVAFVGSWPYLYYLDKHTICWPLFAFPIIAAIRGTQLTLRKKPLGGKYE